MYITDGNLQVKKMICLGQNMNNLNKQEIYTRYFYFYFTWHVKMFKQHKQANSHNEPHIDRNTWPLTQNLTNSNTFSIPHFENFLKSFALFSSLMTQRHRATSKASQNLMPTYQKISFLWCLFLCQTTNIYA
jgi:hypothetical protein